MSSANDVLGLSPRRKRELLKRLIVSRTRSSATPPDTDVHRLVPAPEAWNDPFPLTDIQSAYLIGRGNDFDLGGVACHCYLEIELADIDLNRFVDAGRLVIERHDMLRAVLLPDGNQRILRDVPPLDLACDDMRDRSDEEASRDIDAIRQRMSHQVLPADRWPLFEIRSSLLSRGRTRLHVSFDLLFIDFRSIQIVFRDWLRVYLDPSHPPPPLEISFRDYVLAERAFRRTKTYNQSLEYWKNRLPHLPPAPGLPLARGPAAIRRPRFRRWERRLGADNWGRLKARGFEHGLTPTAVALTAFAEVLALWSEVPRFTINLTLSVRLPFHSQVNDLVGDFTAINFLAVDHSQRDTFVEHARQLHDQLAADLKHRFVNGVQLVRESPHAPAERLMPIVFTSFLSVDTTHQTAAALAVPGEVVYAISQTPQIWLDHQLREESGALVVTWDVVEELFPPGLIDQMFEAYWRLLTKLSSGNQDVWQQRARTVALDEAPREWSASIGPSGLLFDGFLDHVRLQPEQPAVVASNTTLTYRELLERANALARRLRDRGAIENTLVAIVLEKGWEQVAGALAVLQSGAAYLPLDPRLPTERLNALLTDGEVTLAVTSRLLDDALEWPDTMRRVRVDDEDEDARSSSPLGAPRADDLAYVIYTSGSTGAPKGVMIEHRAAVNTLVDINQRFAVGPGDRLLALSALSFDLSVYDIFGALAAGATVVMPEDRDRHNPAQWADLIRQHHITIWNSVPALAELLVETCNLRQDRPFESLRLVLLSGDWIPISLPDQIRRIAPNARIVSLGGATEAAIWSVIFPIDSVDPEWKSIPYGRSLQNQRCEVLDQNLERCPVWKPGQIHISGAGLARGYWRNRALTDEAFIMHPSSGERLYRTGDIGCYQPDGNIRFLGRADSQVKIRGHRIELEEIECALGAHPDVRACAAVVEGEDQRLVAYAVPASGRSVTSGALQQFLRKKLPSYMVPSAISIVVTLPLTGSGKVDRAALAAAVVPRTGHRPAPPEQPGASVHRIAEIIGQVLDRDGISSDTDLLGLGATSIDLIRIANRFESELAFRPSIDDVYRNPTVAGLMALYERQGGLEQPSTQRVLLDPVRREAFRRERHGIRTDLEDKMRVAFASKGSNESRLAAYEARRSHRQFSLKPVPASGIGALMACVQELSVNGRTGYLYPSAGALYPLQTYLYVKAGRVEGLSGGIFYVHPAGNGILLDADPNLDRTIYDPFINRPIFDEAAFAIFLVARVGAIAPIYGDLTAMFVAIEAGYMGQLLMTAAGGHQIGLCPIGYLDFDQIRSRFLLDPDDYLVHSLLGGRLDLSTTSLNAEEKDDRPGLPAARLLRRINELTPEEVAALLDANRRDGSPSR